MLKTSICIIGGGPAGLAASLTLSKNGIKHILIERNDTPKEKVCGECYDGRLIKTLNKINPEIVSQLFAENVIQHITDYQYINTKNKVLHIKADKQKATLRVSTYRPNFDAFLLAKALESPYLQYINGISIVNKIVENNKIYLYDNEKLYTIEADLAIIATGNQSLFANEILKNKIASNQFLLITRRYYKRLQTNLINGFFQVYFINKPIHCYLYIVSLPNDQFTVELMVVKKIAQDSKINLELLFEKIIAEHTYIASIFANAELQGKPKGAALPLTSDTKHKLSAERILFAGSSGSHVNPLTGWGVGHAIFQAHCAAEQCIKSLQQQDFSTAFLSQYDSIVQQDLANDLQKGRGADFVMQYAHNPTNWLLGIVASNTFLSKKVATAIVNA